MVRAVGARLVGLLGVDQSGVVTQVPDRVRDMRPLREPARAAQLAGQQVHGCVPEILDVVGGRPQDRGPLARAAVGPHTGVEAGARCRDRGVDVLRIAGRHRSQPAAVNRADTVERGPRACRCECAVDHCQAGWAHRARALVPACDVAEIV